jgi:hypothetical protein
MIALSPLLIAAEMAVVVLLDRNSGTGPVPSVGNGGK